MKATVFSLTGSKGKEIELPKVFSSPIDAQLIKRAVIAFNSSTFQPHGVNPEAGRDNTARYVGTRSPPAQYRTINIAHARLPRLINRRFLASGRVMKVPQAVGGPSGKPPKKEKLLVEEINKKERRKALASAIAASAKATNVKKRGHLFDEKIFPVIVENAFEDLKKTKDVIKALEALKVYQDVEKAKNARSVRAGKGKKRGRKYKNRKSVLIVTSSIKPVYKAARNLSGVEVIPVKDLNAAHLAPGCNLGRLTVWTEEAVKKLNN
jgi:large subunit ribosomal protein L4e